MYFTICYSIYSFAKPQNPSAEEPHRTVAKASHGPLLQGRYIMKKSGKLATGYLEIITLFLLAAAPSFDLLL